MKTYRVVVRVTCDATYEIEAKSKSEATGKAKSQAENGDIQGAEDVDAKVIDCVVVEE